MATKQTAPNKGSNHFMDSHEAKQTQIPKNGRSYSPQKVVNTMDALFPVLRFIGLVTILVLFVELGARWYHIIILLIALALLFVRDPGDGDVTRLVV